MKINKRFIGLFFVVQAVCFVIYNQQQIINVIEEQAVVKKCCHCGPIEHVFYKLCVKNYNKFFAATGLLENNDCEGLSANVVEALQMLVQTVKFVDQDNNVIIPTLNAKGNLMLPMSKNEDYVMLKAILAKVDVTTTLSADTLCQQWLEQLAIVKTVS